LSFANVHTNLEIEAKTLNNEKKRIKDGIAIRKVVAVFDLVAW
jgi:hypothetical protein